MAGWKSVFFSAVLFLSACAENGSIVFDGNTFSDFFNRPKDSHVTAAHFQNGDVLSLKRCLAREAVSVCFPPKETPVVIKGESCKCAVSNLVIFPLACSSASAGNYECKMHTTHTSNGTPTCSVEGKNSAPVVISCPVSYE